MCVFQEILKLDIDKILSPQWKVTRLPSNQITREKFCIIVCLKIIINKDDAKFHSKHLHNYLFDIRIRQNKLVLKQLQC